MVKSIDQTAQVLRELQEASDRISALGDMVEVYRLMGVPVPEDLLEEQTKQSANLWWLNEKSQELGAKEEEALAPSVEAAHDKAMRRLTNKRTRQNKWILKRVPKEGGRFENVHQLWQKRHLRMKRKSKHAAMVATVQISWIDQLMVMVEEFED